MSATRLPSLDLVRNEVATEREMQLRHFDGLDAKAGVILGFAGLLAVLAPGESSLLLEFARLAAVCSAGAALFAFWPRDYPVTDVATLRQEYVASEIGFTKLRLMDSQIVMIAQAREQMRTKARRLKVATGALALSVLLVAVAFGVRFLRG